MNDIGVNHRHDQAILERWLSNKTPEIFKSWIKQGNSLLVVVEDSKILAVGCVTDTGDISSMRGDEFRTHRNVT